MHLTSKQNHSQPISRASPIESLKGVEQDTETAYGGIESVETMHF